MKEKSSRIFGWIVLQFMASMVFSTSVSADENRRIEFSNKNSLEFSRPLSEREAQRFAGGLKFAAYVDVKGEAHQLFPLEFFSSSGGVIYDASNIRTSNSGHFVVLEILRSATVDSGQDGKPFVQSREYCPVMNTQTGCILSNNTGGVCGGDWDESQDKWLRSTNNDATNEMLGYRFLSANALWASYVSAEGKSSHYPLRQLLKDNLGVDNMLLCEPINRNNKKSYKAIAEKLQAEGAKSEALKVDKILAQFSKDTSVKNNTVIVAKKAILFDEPDEGHQTKAYLIKGDNVKILKKIGADWVLIEYTGNNGVVRKWVKATTLSL